MNHVGAAARPRVGLAALYDHQDDAVAAIMRACIPSPRARRPQFRAQLHMAPGLGKTRVAARVADLVAGRGSLLMVGPTRTLLEQTYHVLHAAGRSGPVIAVYSLRGAALTGEPGVRVSTHPQVVAWHANAFAAQGEGRFTVLATYASVENSLIAGHRLSVERDARPLPEWDLLVCDESHHTETSRVWGRINEQHLVPAWHRLSMTATPRLLGAVRYDEQGRLVVSDPVVRLSEREHGPVAYRLGLREAQRRGKLARSPVVAAEVDEARLRELVAARGRADAGVLAELLTASLGAVLRAAGRVGRRRLLAYHSTVAGARAAAASLPQLARVLHGQGISAPRRVWAVALHEGTPAEERQRALATLAAGTDLRGRPVDLAVVCSVRLLSEGVDVPAVDAVALVDPRAAQGDLLQIAGRAVRYDWENPDKVASIIVPVLHLARAADGTLVGPDWVPVINMLHALESYEPDLIDQEDQADGDGHGALARRLERAGRSTSRGPYQGRLRQRPGSARFHGGRLRVGLRRWVESTFLIPEYRTSRRGVMVEFHHDGSVVLCVDLSTRLEADSGVPVDAAVVRSLAREAVCAADAHRQHRAPDTTAEITAIVVTADEKQRLIPVDYGFGGPQPVEGTRRPLRLRPASTELPPHADDQILQESATELTEGLLHQFGLNH
ncbi:DEAD/DEAH box helicase [Streptomyces sp. NPDC053474]|uniref:DEAD/DEAH box helicase n=1 Tax=Streptomyces sp. NPDC053474 TaxID=3365704 RepID=UPI0037D36456